LRVAYLGNADWSVPPLEAVHRSDHTVVLVLTRDPRPAGRGHRLRRTPVAEAADRLDLPLIETPTAARGEGFERLAAAAPDVLAVVAYGEILPQTVLDVPSLIPVNVHFSLLPRWRGAAPVQRAILAGDMETGVTTMRMTAGLDEGPVLLECRVSIADDEDAGTLGTRLAAVGGGALVDTLDQIAAGRIEERPQGPDDVTIARSLRPAERRIEWTSPAELIARQVRAFGPAPGATALFRGEPLKVLRARVATGVGGAGGHEEPGTPIATAGGGLAVAAADGWVELLDVAPAGRPRMSGAAFARGHRPVQGDFVFA
jgi:methionyl-tRNA formyltransferase